MKRRLITILLATAMALGLTACGDKAESAQPEQAANAAGAEATNKPEKTEEPKATEAPELKQTSYAIMNAYPFSEERAWVEYADTDANVTYTALIDTEGNVLYKTEKTAFEPMLMNSGVSAINVKKAKDDANEYHFIDKDGNDLGSLAEDDAKVTVLGSYQGKFLVMEEKSGFSANTLEFYIADKSGKKAAEPLAEVDLSASGSRDDAIYNLCDDGRFSYAYALLSEIHEGGEISRGQYVSEFGHLIMAYWNSESSFNYYMVLDIADETAIVYNGFSSGMEAYDVWDTEKGIYIEYSTGINCYIPMKENYGIEEFYEVTSTLKTYRYPVITKDGRVIDHDGALISSYDIATGEPIIEDVDLGGRITETIIPSYDGQHLAVMLYGADGNSYVTVLDKDLKMLYEPQPRDYVDGNIYVVNGYIVPIKTNNQGDFGGYTPDGKPISYKNDDVSGIGNDAVCMSGSWWFLSGGFINNHTINGEHGYRSLDGNTIITQVVVTE